MTELANLCISKTEHLTERKINAYFLNGLTYKQREYIITAQVHSRVKATKILFELEALQNINKPVSNIGAQEMLKQSEKEKCKKYSKGVHADKDCFRHRDSKKTDIKQYKDGHYIIKKPELKLKAIEFKENCLNEDILVAIVTGAKSNFISKQWLETKKNYTSLHDDY